MLIWVVNIDLFVLENIDNPQWLFLLSTLTSDESDKVQRFHYFDDKKRAILSLLLQKAVIRKFCNLKDNQSFEIQRTVEGKPFPTFKNEETESLSISSVLANNWNYNVSHHGQYVSIISASKILVNISCHIIIYRL
jgi:4'-phosphopantetheinyl transferase